MILKRFNIITDKNNEHEQTTEKPNVEENIGTCLHGAPMVHRSTSISPDRILNSPIKTKIRKVYTREIKTLKRKISVSRYQQKKIQKRLLTLKDVLKNVQKRNLLTAEDSDILQHLDAGTQDLIKRDIRKRKNLPVSRLYKPSLRQFALSLHYYSPKAYNYV